MIDRPPPRALARARLLAELDQSLTRARAQARALAADPQCTFEAGLLAAQLDRIAAEVEQIRLGQLGRNADPANGDTRPRTWRGPQG